MGKTGMARDSAGNVLIGYGHGHAALAGKTRPTNGAGGCGDSHDYLLSTLILARVSDILTIKLWLGGCDLRHLLSIAL